MAEARPRIVLIRHGETEWSRAGRHTGRSDIPLTPRGEEQAAGLAGALAGHRFALVLSSPLARAHRTAELAGLAELQDDPDLQEWDYGGYEGLTTPDIVASRPGFVLWRDGVVPGRTPGESVHDVGARADRVLARAVGAMSADSGDVALVGHGHALRVLTARWLQLSPHDGALFRLDPASVCLLSHEHSRPVVEQWNLRPVHQGPT